MFLGGGEHNAMFLFDSRCSYKSASNTFAGAKNQSKLNNIDKIIPIIAPTFSGAKNQSKLNNIDKIIPIIAPTFAGYKNQSKSNNIDKIISIITPTFAGYKNQSKSNNIDKIIPIIAPTFSGAKNQSKLNNIDKIIPIIAPTFSGAKNQSKSNNIDKIISIITPIPPIPRDLISCAAYINFNKLRNRKLKCFVRIIASSLTFSLALASSFSFAKESSKPSFVIDAKPPVGFDDKKMLEQHTVISINYQGKFLLNTPVIFNDKTIKFTKPKQVLSQIKDLKEDKNTQAIFKNILTKPIKFTDLKACKNKTKGICKSRDPKILGIVLDAQNYQASIWVNHQYVSINPVHNFKLPDASAGLALTNGMNIFLEKYPNFFEALWRNYTKVSLRNHSVLFRTHVEGHKEYDTNDTKTYSQFGLEQVLYHSYNQGYYLSAGMLSTQGSSLISGSNYLGASIQNFGIVSSKSAQATPILLYLTTPSNISVYKGQQLISVQKLSAGNQYLDTSSFPIGSYQIDIKIRDQFMHERQLSQFFVKQSDQGLTGNINYRIGVGVIQREDENTSSAIHHDFSHPIYANIPLLSLDWVGKINDKLSIKNYFVSDVSVTYGTLGLESYLGPLHIAPGGVFSSIGDRGAFIDSNLSLGHFNAYLQYLRLFHVHAAADSLLNNSQGSQFDGDIRASKFNPLTIAKSQLNTSMSYYWSKTSLSLGYSLYKMIGSSGDSHSLNFGLTQSLLQNDSGQLQLTLNGSSNNLKGDGSQYVLSVSYQFATPELMGNLNLGTHHDEGKKLTENNNTSISGSVSKTVNFGEINQNHAIFSLAGNAQGKSHAIGANMDYYSDPIHGFASFGLTNSPETQRTQNVIAQFDSSFSITSAGMAWGSDQSHYTGVMVNLAAPLDRQNKDNKDKSKGLGRFKNTALSIKTSAKSISAEVLIDNEPVTVLTSNHSKAIYLSPYHQYKIKIQPLGPGLYDYDKSTKKVSLYEGNIIPLTWKFSHEYLLFANIEHLVAGKWEPLKNSLLKTDHDYDKTDNDGFIQATLTDKSKDLVFIDEDAKSCIVHLSSKDLASLSSKNIKIINKPLHCV